MAVGEVRPIAIERSSGAKHGLRIDRRERDNPTASVLAVVWLAHHAVDPPTFGARLARAALAPYLSSLTEPPHDVDCRVVRATGRHPARADEPLQLDRHALGQPLHGEQRAQVVRDRVKATRVHEPRAASLGLL